MNHPLSGTSRLLEVACLNHPRTVWSNILYPLTPVSGKLLNRNYLGLFNSLLYLNCRPYGQPDI